ncbi:GNAT family N-acetyltransferase [Bradyrhizobium sp. CIR48]|uniref:GNAT family N-acetyltransferase n=1 Tax=Bradyrhizobium sp. CIR48 TaxID=2663840 RepID=UPI0016065B87|nr:GNAT family N-acetyltransferase [Bradyrhizobium sp. CIR48]
MRYELRRLRECDLPEVTEIYTAACRDRESTQGTRRWSVAEMHEFIFARRPSFVSYTCIRKGNVIGWAALTQHHVNEGVRQTAELSLFVQGPFRSKGVGSALARAILRQPRTDNLHCVLAMTFADAPNAIAFAERKCGLSIVGCLPGAFSHGEKNYDILVLQRLLVS